MIRLLSAVLLVLGIYQVAISGEDEERRTYDFPIVNVPEFDTLLVIGEEEYRAQVESLIDLPGVYVFMDWFYAAGRAKSVDLTEGMAERVKQKLSAAGISILTKDEMLETPSQPEMQIYLSVTQGEQTCCASVWVSLLQGVQILRAPQVRRRVGTWGNGEGQPCPGDPAAIESMVMRQIDKFIDDHTKAAALSKEDLC